MSAKIKSTVLIVDDNRDAADMLAILVQMAGGEASVAYDSATGIAIAHSSPPDFIFHDIGMPLMNGYDAARFLRQCKKFAKTTLVAVTGYSSAADRERAKLAGFDLHMAKPVEFEDVKRMLSSSNQPN
jgi:CheY-like chemotaxis protein